MGVIDGSVTIGILALQGAFAEHEAIIKKLRLKCQPSTDPPASSPNAAAVIPLLVKTPTDLASCDALIIPGGESTTIALLAKLNGLLEPLRTFSQHKPIWGTCAGAILLSSGGVVGAKRGGQEVIGGVDVKVERNGWGPQLESFEADLDVEVLEQPKRPFKGVFIRAPVILALTPTHQTPPRPPIQVVARLSDHHSLDEESSTDDDARRIVAVRQGHHLLTAFHPELTKDSRFHEYFVRECVIPSVQGDILDPMNR
ncbi:SNO glutamine amidotransferase [Clavulina sp. PMI_390]|nr:SNO glutamine amidotransferase [Clavulina sp. PMI_390]